jgi:hypothetical protein
MLYVLAYCIANATIVLGMHGPELAHYQQCFSYGPPPFTSKAACYNYAHGTGLRIPDNHNGAITDCYPATVFMVNR